MIWRTGLVRPSRSTSGSIAFCTVSKAGYCRAPRPAAVMTAFVIRTARPSPTRLAPFVSIRLEILPEPTRPVNRTTCRPGVLGPRPRSHPDLGPRLRPPERLRGVAPAEEQLQPLDPSPARQRPSAAARGQRQLARGHPERCRR